MRPIVFLPLVFAACVPEANVSDWPEGLAELAPLSSGSCPEFDESGRKQFVSNGIERTVHLFYPKGWDPGMPAVFFWHPLGASAGQFANAIQAQTIADRGELALIFPQATADEPYEWAFYTDHGANDAVLYDDLRTCLVQHLEVDPERITSAGMSAGGLWTTWLTMHRSDTLATSLVMSGGTGQVVYYAEPAVDIPVLVMWGGESDTFQIGSRTVDFAAQSVQFSDALQEDGHFVVECDHGTGHTIPIDGIGAIPEWLLAHRWAEDSPFIGGDLTGLPDYCRIPEGSQAEPTSAP